MEFDYRTRVHELQLADLKLKVRCLESLDQTIDQLFKHIETTGDTRALEDLCPYFGVVWPAGRALSEVLAHQPLEALKGKRFIEVGCGLAIPSLVAALRGAGVTATDFHPDVPGFLSENLLLSGVELSYVHMNWQTEPLPPQVQGGSYDWVVGSDILYEKQHPEHVASALERLLKPGGKLVVADPGRPYLQTFVDAMKKRGFDATLQSQSEVFVFSFSSIQREK